MAGERRTFGAAAHVEAVADSRVLMEVVFGNKRMRTCWDANGGLLWGGGADHNDR
jgi:hypothetical protein